MKTVLLSLILLTNLHWYERPDPMACYGSPPRISCYGLTADGCARVRAGLPLSDCDERCSL